MNTRRTLMIAAALGLGAALAAPGLASAEERDFSQYTTEELVQMRTEARQMSEADRAKFRAEMQQRARAMTPEEREAQGFGQRGRAQARQAEGAERGQGELKRERRRVHKEGEFGRGYESRQQERPRDGGGPRRDRGDRG